MARKGTALVKTPNKKDKYKIIDSDSNEVSPYASSTEDGLVSPPVKGRRGASHTARNSNHGPALNKAELARRLQKLSSGPEEEPRQASPAVKQSRALADALFPKDDADKPATVAQTEPTLAKLEATEPTLAKLEATESTLAKLEATEPAAKPAVIKPAVAKSTVIKPPVIRFKKGPKKVTKNKKPEQAVAPGDASLTKQPPGQVLPPASSTVLPRSERPSTPPPRQLPEDNMASGGSYISPSQQRNMRACMVCSAVRTHQQFLQQGCPNCEDVLELINNPDAVNDCTSSVFEGLICVVDTKRSWVARHQRLEGYVPGLYATQVEGILPEDVLSAVEAAGINYVPRDGSEQEMLPKD